MAVDAYCIPMMLCYLDAILTPEVLNLTTENFGFAGLQNMKNLVQASGILHFLPQNVY